MKNKFSSYLIYAIGEIALVMIGILLALQVNNWNEEKKRSNQLTNILKTVRADLVTDTIIAASITRYYDTINKYSQKVMKHEITSENLHECIPCRSLITVYQPMIIQKKGYEQLEDFSDHSARNKDSLVTDIGQFYRLYSKIIEDNNTFIKEETLENLDDFKSMPWFIDWMQGKLTEEVKDYFGNSSDYKNRVAANFILASSNHTRFIKEYHKSAALILERIDERIEITD